MDAEWQHVVKKMMLDLLVTILFYRMIAANGSLQSGA